MSMMCKNAQCSNKKGMCGHEKMMMGVMFMVVAVGVFYWFA